MQAGSLGDIYMSETEVKRRYDARIGGQRTGRKPRNGVWSEAETDLLIELMAQGLFAHQMRDRFPLKTLKQVRGKCGVINNTCRIGGLSGLGLQLADGTQADPDALAERNARLDTEDDPTVYLNPNFTLLGDPSPARWALARQQDEVIARKPSVPKANSGAIAVSSWFQALSSRTRRRKSTAVAFRVRPGKGGLPRRYPETENAWGDEVVE